MSQVPPEMERRLRNLQAVARHHAQRNETAPGTAPAGTGSGFSRKWAKRLGTLGPIGVVLLFVLLLVYFTRNPHRNIRFHTCKFSNILLDFDVVIN